MDVVLLPFRPASRLDAVGVSEIVKITARAAERRRAGRPVLVLGAGEPDFDTPDHVKEAAAQAAARGDTKYTALDGTPELKAAVIEKFRRDNGLIFSSSEVTVGAGAKQILFNAMMATINPGDEVVIPSPYWVSYADIVRICGGVPVIVPCSEAAGFRLSPDALEEAITPRTRWLMLNSPSNPTGAAYGEEEYRVLAEVLMQHPQVWLLTDDIYEHIIYDGLRFVTPVAVAPALRERTLTVNGVSKAYAMTGWRIGYAAGPAALIRAMAAVQSQATSCPSSISQAAAVAALMGPQHGLAERALAFRARRDLVVDALNAMPGLRCPTPDGAFYAYASCEGLLGRRTPGGMLLRTDVDVAKFLLDDHDVALVPGTFFGLAPYLRLSYATSEAELRTALERIAAACKELV